MSVRRRPRRFEQEVWEGVRAQRVGGAHDLFSAAPVRDLQTATSDAQASLVSVGGDRDSNIEQFTLASDGAQDLTLEFLPQPKSWNVMIRRSPAFYLDDYTIDGQTLHIIDGEMAPLTGDQVQIQYDYLLGMPVLAEHEPAALPTITTNAGVGTTPALPGGAAAGDFGVCFIALEHAQSIAALNGWAPHGSPVTLTHAASSGTYTYDLYTLTKTLASGSDVPTVTVSGGLLAPAWATAVLDTGGSFDSIATDTASSGTSGTSKAVTTCDGAIRCWFTLSNAGDLTAPGRISISSADNTGLDIQILIGAEADLSAVAASSTVTSGWAMSTVGVNAP